MKKIQSRRIVVPNLVAAIIVGATATYAQLVPPSDPCSVQQWRFDGDGTAGGAVDSGATGTDWINGSVGSLAGAGWSMNATANHDAMFFVDTADNVGGGNGVLWMKDDVNAAGGVPMARLGFGAGAATEGFVQLHAGTAGIANQDARIELMAGNTVLGAIYLMNDNLGFFESGSGTALFFDMSWLDGFRLFQMAWSVNADGTGGAISFHFDGLFSDLSLINQTFLADAVPDNIRFSVGSAEGTGHALRIADLDIQTSGGGGAVLSCPGDMVAVVPCGGTIVPPTPSVTEGCSSVSLVCEPPVVGAGSTLVVWTATDSSGNSATCSYMVHAVTDLQIRVMPPVGDNKGGAHKFKPGQTVPLKVKLFDCDGMDVTALANVDVVLDVVELDSADASFELDLPEAYSGMGSPNGSMKLADDHYQFNLKTSGYEAGTSKSTRYFLARVMVVDKATDMLLGEKAVMMESQ